MEHRRAITSVALAAAVLALGGGCLTPDANKTQAKKPDVTQPGVLPAPQDLMKRTTAAPEQPGDVVPAGGIPPKAAAPVAPAGGTSPGAPSLSKLTKPFEKKTPATEMAVAWQNRIAYLPDPARNGMQGPGIVGQMFLFGGPKLQFAEADGTLTVDLIDDSPRPAGQQPAKPERWQFNTEMLKNLRAMDETFGKSYVLFLPWPAYRPDITRVRISARYDPVVGITLHSQPSAITIDKTPHGTPVWDGEVKTIDPLRLGAGGVQGPGNTPTSVYARPLAESLGPTPTTRTGLTGAIPLGGPPSPPMPVSSIPITPTPGPVPPLPLSPLGAPPTGTMPLGASPIAPTPPPGLEPIAITIGK